MFGSGAMDVAIGLAFVFALLSLICSSVTELISQLLGWRAQTLEQGLRTEIGLAPPGGEQSVVEHGYFEVDSDRAVVGPDARVMGTEHTTRTDCG